MNDEKLIESLNSVGKSCFVSYYEVFRDNARKDPSFVIELLVRNEKYKESGAKIRVNFARAIFDAHRQIDALKIIAQAERIPREFCDKAKLLLNDPAVTLPLAQPTTPTSKPIKRIRANPGEDARSASGVSKEGSLVDKILRHGIWFPPDLLNTLPLLRPYAIRDNACRPRRGNTTGEEQWGSPNSEGFFRDDNSLIKSMPYSFSVNGRDHPYQGRKIGTGFVASHAWRKLYKGTSHENPMTYSFIGNIVWLPAELAILTDVEGGLGQNILKAISWFSYRKFMSNAKAKSLLDEIWSYFPVPDVSILPDDIASRISYFAVDIPRFAETNHGLMKSLLEALAIIERNGATTTLNKIQYGQRSLCDRYSRNLPSKLLSSEGFTRLKGVIHSTIACQI